MSLLSHSVLEGIAAERPVAHVRTRTPSVLGRVSGDVGIRSVLVPLDGTRHAEHALPHALAIAQRNGAVLRIVQVYSYREEAVRRDGLWVEDDPVAAIREPREHYLQSVVQRISRLHQTPVIATLLEDDVPGRQMKALQAQTDLTVLTSRRRGWLSRLCRESMVDLLLDRAERPVLLIRGYDAPADLTGRPLCRHVVVPIEEARSIAHVFHHVQLLGGTESQLITLWPLSDRASIAADDWMTTSSGHGRLKRNSLRTKVVVATHRNGTLATLGEIAGAKDIDLIAIPRPAGAREFSWADPSPSIAIAREAHVPVLILGSPLQTAFLPSATESAERVTRPNLE
jgi:nucleotide-binding universal stress UspA family protein